MTRREEVMDRLLSLVKGLETSSDPAVRSLFEELRQTFKDVKSNEEPLCPVEVEAILIDVILIFCRIHERLLSSSTATTIRQGTRPQRSRKRKDHFERIRLWQEVWRERGGQGKISACAREIARRRDRGWQAERVFFHRNRSVIEGEASGARPRREEPGRNAARRCPLVTSRGPDGRGGSLR